jgi:DNA-binding transcriptional regulator LsrR (DeoR family)
MSTRVVEGGAAKAHAARLHYLRGLTKSEIADRLGVSRFKVARLLEQAREEGIVRVEIAEPVALDDELGDALERRFGLDLAVVARGDDPEGPPRAAAAWLPELLGPDGVLGVAWGATLERVADALPPGGGPPRAVVQMCGAVAGVNPGAGPAELAWRFAERLGGRPFPLPAPALTSRRQAREDLLTNPAVGPTVAMWERITLAVLGVGSLEEPGRSSLVASGAIPPRTVAALRRRGAVGDLLVHVFDAEGRMVGAELAARAVAVPVERLAAVPRVLAVAGGAGKARAIAGALRTGLLDALVTDEAGARAALGTDG